MTRTASKSFLARAVMAGSLLAMGGAMPTAVFAQAKDKAPAPGTKTNWAATRSITANGSHTVGNPKAPIKLTEYVSYTCSHCADFTKQSEPVLSLTMIPKGEIQITVSNLVRNPVDLTAALLTNCGDPNRFFVRHRDVFARQESWMAKLQATTSEQRQRWTKGTYPERFRAIASDLDFYELAKGWGLSRSEADTCLADEAQLEKILSQLEQARSLQVPGTPGLILNGKLQPYYDWESLSKDLAALSSARKAASI